jgi:hypothetical protein
MSRKLLHDPKRAVAGVSAYKLDQAAGIAVSSVQGQSIGCQHQHRATVKQQPRQCGSGSSVMIGPAACDRCLLTPSQPWNIRFEVGTGVIAVGDVMQVANMLDNRRHPSKKDGDQASNPRQDAGWAR